MTDDSSLYLISTMEHIKKQWHLEDHFHLFPLKPADLAGSPPISGSSVSTPFHTGCSDCTLDENPLSIASAGTPGFGYCRMSLSWYLTPRGISFLSFTEPSTINLKVLLLIPSPCVSMTKVYLSTQSKLKKVEQGVKREYGGKLFELSVNIILSSLLHHWLPNSCSKLQSHLLCMNLTML